MQGRIPESTLAEIRDRANIVEVVSGHVGLRKVGRNHVGLCPFHAEKTPSFTVNDDRAMFHCFGCGAGGNVFGFLMRIESLAFPEAVERLAHRYGVQLPERGDDDPALRLRESLFRLNDKTAQFYARYLWDSPDAKVARAYLAERGIGRATAERYHLGYAPESGDALVRRMRSAGIALEQAERLGLIGARREGGGHYDRFRGRVMFPITDASGRVVGFGSRGIPGTTSDRRDLPKYLNSPETPLYRKGSHLYGLSFARDAIRGADRVLVVEGYFDVLALVEAGVGHVVASLGTALTLDQLKVLRRFTRNIVAFFDGDAAGAKAAEKALPLFFDAGLWGHAAVLPTTDDPDTFVRREGRDAVETLVAQARPLLEFYLERKVGPGSTPAQRATVAHEVAAWLAKISDPFEFEIIVQKAAQRLGVPEPSLRPRGNAGRTSPRPVTRPSLPQHAGDRPRLETALIELVLGSEAAARRFADVPDAAELFTDPELRTLVEDVIIAVHRGDALDSAMLLMRVDDRTATVMREHLLGEAVARDAEAVPLVDKYMAALRQKAVVRQSKAVDPELIAADATLDPAAQSAYLSEKIELNRQRNEHARARGDTVVDVLATAKPASA